MIINVKKKFTTSILKQTQIAYRVGAYEIQ